LIDVGLAEDHKNEVFVIYQGAIKSPGPGIAQGDRLTAFGRKLLDFH
jgi:hypothetical protein